MGEKLKFTMISIITLIIYVFIWNLLIDKTQETFYENMKKDIQVVEQELQRRFELLEAIANIEELAEKGVSYEEKAEHINNRFRAEGLERISIVDLEGNSYGNAGKIVDVADRWHYNQALQGKSVIEGPIVSRRDGKVGMVYAMPFYGTNNKVEGVIYAIYDYEYIRDTIYRHLSDFKRDTIIFNNKQEVVFDQEATSEKILKYQEEISSIKEPISYITVEGNRHLVIQAPIPDTTWQIYKVISTSILYKPVNTVMFFVGIILIGGLMIIYRRIKRDDEVRKKSIDQLENSENIIVLRLNLQGEVVYANKYARNTLGYSEEEIQSKNIKHLLVYKDVGIVKALLKKHEHKITSLAINFQTKSYERLYAICTINKIDFNDQFEISAIDVSEYNLGGNDKELINNLYKLLANSEEELQKYAKELLDKQDALKESEKQLKYLAYYDEQTKLPNKNCLKQTAKECIENLGECAIILLEIDNFKFIHDSFGHEYVDSILEKVGNKLRILESNRCKLFKLELNEFGILIEGAHEEENLLDILSQIQDLFRESFSLKDIKFFITFSIGIARCPKDGKDYNELMTNADTAMNKAKEKGKGQYMFFDSIFKTALIEKVHMENNLRRAIKEGEFVLYYQPQIDIKTNTLKGFEALIRWITPDGKMISPFHFIELAEECGLIVPIGDWVIEEACRFIKRLEERGWKEIYVAVNVSVIQLVQEDFVDKLEKALSKMKINPKMLHIEITETILMESIETNLKTLQKVKEKGAQVSLDDFGKGYSSLTYLKRLPIDVLKIEKTFIDDILLDKEKNITSSIINLGHELNLEVVAEGVETQQQRTFLAESGCDMIQGYLISKPVPEEQIFDVIEKYRV